MPPPPSSGPLKPHRVVLYFPAKQRDGTPIENHENLAQGLELLLCGEMGGVTRYPAVGNYKTESGAVHREQVEVFELYCEAGDWERQRVFLEELAAELATVMVQETIALACDGRLILVPGGGSAGGIKASALQSEMTPAEVAGLFRSTVEARLQRGSGI